MVPEKLVVQLRGRAETCQSSKAGTYILQSTDVNGKKHWLAENSNNAIWYFADSQSKNARWMIGLKKNLGKNLGGIFSPDDTATPYEATTWIPEVTTSKMTFQELSFINDNDVIVAPILNGKN